MSISTPARRGPGTLVRAMALVIAVVVSLAGCGSAGSEPDSAKAKTGSAAASFPVTIKHGHGSTTVEQKPQRIVALSWMSLDVVSALGTVPVGVDEQWGGDKQGYTPWFRGTVEKLGGPLPEILNRGDAGEIDFEQILSLEPDLIIGLYSGITDVEYKRLSEIAPTVPYLKKPWDGGTWQEMTRTIGKAMGENTKAESLVTDVQGQLAAVAEDHPEFKDKTFAYGVAFPPGTTEVGLYVDYDARVRLLTEMGFKNTPSMSAIASTVKGTNWYGGVSLEKLDTIEADIFVAWASGPDEVEHTLKDPLFSRWKPIAGKHYAFVQDPTMGMATSGPSVLSIPWAIERYVPMLADAVSGKGNTGADF
ncbi:iron-siderophore ABC transporter substrate-binding protein [Streptomyces sp. NBC_01591]|uniref:iron-siderophore ABC transporter substrate-binding protein n=1 Tax=Streptomyces sp. NBC_01591 TaxID=2975888 RepID=UPI002DDC7890|nr:iron-siderophore ABC transporter substrate-binding protein [Streptomyces sp. NBC_01591]WSD72470.1 iron-siderophore ABC transporter substrate-binding protein [Streptomyces sp. NBC_01591]